MTKMYNTLVAAIGDYLGKPIEFGKNATHFSHYDEFCFGHFLFV